MGNRETALALAAAGIPVFPCWSGGPDAKRPLPRVFWRHQSTTDRRAIERWWDQYPDAAPSIDLAKTQYLVIDLDRHGGPDGVEAWSILCREHGDPRPPSVETPSGGRHLYFRQPAAPLGNRRGALPPGIDVRGAGGFVLAPHAVMADGRGYRPSGDIAEAPPLPPWLEAMLRAERVHAEPERPAPAAPVPAPTSPSSNARRDAYADAAIEAELAELRAAPKGARNETLNRVAFKLGTMVGAGWLTEAAAVAALAVAAADIGLVKDDGLRQVRATIRSGLKSGTRKPRELPAEAAPTVDGAEVARRLVEARDGTLHDAETGEVVEVAAPVAAGEMPRHLLDPPGLVGEVAAWITDTARRPQPGFAIGAALAVVGTAAGRQLAGPTLSGTHLYVVALGPTSAGKDHPLQQCGRILRAAGMGHHVGPSEFISMPAAIRFLLRSPLSLCPMDEFGAFIKRINNRRASGFEASISKILRTAWGASFQTLTTPEWAGRESETVVAPALSIYGASTEEEFYGALEGADQDNGVLNRFLIIATRQRPAERDPLASPFDVPPSIVDGVRAIYFRSGELAAAQRNAPNLDQCPAPLAWGLEARDLYEGFAHEVEERGDADPVARPFLGRTVEMALRIATIVAIGRGEDAVSIDDMAYGRDLALWSVDMLIRGAREHMADTETQAAANRVLALIRKRGGRIRHRDLLRGMAHRLTNKALKELISAMVEAEQISAEKTTPEGGGPPTIWYNAQG